ncbi:hypothetical protein C0J52_27775 [Blattella germanica]|nr:hypothetical protein C0J52_27775 [Blattella germanica]
MKSRLKKKTDLRMTGNKSIKLNNWEQKRFSLMDGDTNPAVKRIEDAVICDGSKRVELEFTSSSFNEEMNVPTTSLELPTVITPPPPSKRRRSNNRILQQYETEETKDMCTSDLERLVLLQQLAAIKEQRELYKEIRQGMADDKGKQMNENKQYTFSKFINPLMLLHHLCTFLIVKLFRKI